jgi:hypothetical protein
MTLDEVMAAQKANKAFAIGAYQFIPSTLEIAVKAAKLPGGLPFSPETQDWLAAVLLLGGKRPALAAYLSGKSDDMAAAQLDLAKEWASIPGPDGRGVYDGDSAGNRAHIQMEATQAALKAARAGLAGGTMATIKPAPPARPNAAPVIARPKHTNPLAGVPYYSQRDSAQASQRDRTCFSSACAMLLETLKPGTLKGANGDDQYLAVVQRFGDTTSHAAQIKALATYGIKARMRYDCTFDTIEEQINRGYPVPCGYLHRGPVDRPNGSGHWLTVYGINRTHLTVHDPWGEPNLLTGATVNSDGRALKFTRANFGQRWMVEPVGGAYRYAPGNGWAIYVD